VILVPVGPPATPVVTSVVAAVRRAPRALAAVLERAGESLLLDGPVWGAHHGLRCAIHSGDDLGDRDTVAVVRIGCPMGRLAMERTKSSRAAIWYGRSLYSLWFTIATPCTWGT